MYNVCMKTLPHIQDLRRILVLRGDGFLADAIISSCCYRELKKANPNLKITVACFGPAYILCWVAFWASMGGYDIGRDN